MKGFCTMNKNTQPQKDLYETPEIQEIQPVTVAVGQDPQSVGGVEDPNAGVGI